MHCSKASLNGDVMGVSSPSFQDMTLRMKHGLSMYSFISRFHMVALAFNSYIVLGSNVICKLCSLLRQFAHLKNTVCTEERNKYKKRLTLDFDGKIKRLCKVQQHSAIETAR